MEHRAEPANDHQTDQQSVPDSREDDLLAVITQVEQQLERLRAAQTERDDMRARLEGWEAALARQQEQIRAEAASAVQEHSRLEVQKAQLQQETAEFTRVREQAEDQLRGLAEEQRRTAAEQEKREIEFQRQAQALAEREETMARRLAALEKQEHQLAQRIGELSQTEERLHAAAAELESAKAQMEELGNRLAEAQREATKRAQEASEARAAAQAAGSAAQSASAELAQLREQLERQGEHAMQVQALQDELSRAQQMRSRLEAALEERTADLRAAAEGSRAAADTQDQLAARDAQVRELAEKLQQARGEVQDLTRAMQEQAALAAQAQAISADLHARDARIRQLEEQLAGAQSAPAADPAPDEALHAHVQSLEAQLADLQEQLGSATGALAQSQQEMRHWQAEASEAAQTAQVLRAQLADRPADAVAVPGDLGQKVMRRWNRLRLMRSLLRDQHEKLRRAGEALRERNKEYEQLVAEREHVARLRTALLDARRQGNDTESRAPSRRLLALVSYMVVAFCGLLGLSWAVSGHIAPAKYAARAVLAAESPTGEAGHDQLAEWQRYHESLITDAAMMQLAADRMARHGIVSLGTPGQVSSRLQSDLVVQSPQDGTLIVELRGSGRSKTTRELEIFSTALASQANATRGRRADGLGTMIAEPAAAGDPLSDARMFYAVAIFGIGAALASFMGLALWRRMSDVKESFEKELHADVAAEQANWTEAPEAFARPRT